MCGIAGFANISKDSFLVDELLLEQMQETIKHRGPDGYRIWGCDQFGIGLVHRRLSIVDLSDNAFQPLFDHEKSIAVVCNGEIYNHLTLRAELENFGHIFQTKSDTEVIVYAYKQWGIACLEKLEGMFSIVIVDRKKEELYIVRDRMGVKPIYFSLQGGVLSFASEIKALWQLPWMEKKLSKQGLYHYLTYLVTPAPMTIYDQVYKLPPSYYLKMDKLKNVTFHEWYTPIKQIDAKTKFDLQNKSESYWIEEIRRLLRESVKKRLMADVPYGAFLSGGIDSSLIVALMSEMTDKVKTFNISFSDGPEYSEIEWARKVAKKFGTDHHEALISEKEAFEFYEKMVWHQDEPIADCVCIPVYYVAKLLKDSGVTVALVGEGSDELFCGYANYASHIDIYNKYWKYSQFMVPSLVKKGLFYGARKRYPDNPRLLEYLFRWAYNRSLFWSGAIAFSEQFKEELLLDFDFSLDPVVSQILGSFNQVKDSYSVVDYYIHKLKQHDNRADFIKTMIYLELKHRLPELLLTRVDKMTMATSVEARVPFLDHKIVDMSFLIPSQLKYKNRQTKYILKKAAETIIPHDVIYRKKVGFAAPMARWFREGKYFKTYFQDNLYSKNNDLGNYFDIAVIQSFFNSHATMNHDYSSQLWVIQNVMMNKFI